MKSRETPNPTESDTFFELSKLISTEQRCRRATDIIVISTTHKSQEPLMTNVLLLETVKCAVSSMDVYCTGDMYFITIKDEEGLKFLDDPAENTELTYRTTLELIHTLQKIPSLNKHLGASSNTVLVFSSCYRCIGMTMGALWPQYNFGLPAVISIDEEQAVMIEFGFGALQMELATYVGKSYD
ncbi:MAG: hypothetical protein JSS82_15850 [Bacteroidetes bacterium]|nr:hypothetical protein [Bacteroidota bacterium]